MSETSNTYLHDLFVDEVQPALMRWANIGSGGTIEPLEVTENGTYTAPEGIDGYSPVTVNVAGGGNSAISIEDNAYLEASGLTHISIPNTVTSIGSNAFSNSGLRSVILPKGLNALWDYAFAECYSLNAVVFRGTPDEHDGYISAFAFSYSNINDIYVPWEYGEVGGAPWGADTASIHYGAKFDVETGSETYISFVGNPSTCYFCIEKPNGEVLRYYGSLSTEIDGVGYCDSWSHDMYEDNDKSYEGLFAQSFYFTETGTFHFWGETDTGLVTNSEIYDVTEGAKRIEFTVNGSTYTAEEGMTWEEWCNSATYNYYGVGFIADGSVYWSGCDFPLDVSPSDVIVDGAEFNVI